MTSKQLRSWYSLMYGMGEIKRALIEGQYPPQVKERTNG